MTTVNPLHDTACDETTCWQRWGGVLFSHPLMLREILEDLPPAQARSEENERVLAVYSWLQAARHPQVELLLRPTGGDEVELSLPMVVRANSSPWRPAAGAEPSPVMLFSGGQPYSQAEALHWPRVHPAAATVMADRSSLGPWMEHIHQAEQRWVALNPETIMARIEVVGPTARDDNMEGVKSQSCSWEALADVLALPIPHRALVLDSATPPPDFLREKLLKGSCLPPLIAGQWWLRSGEMSVKFHPPSPRRLAEIATHKLQTNTAKISASTHGLPRL